MSDDAILIGEDFLSEHYATTGAASQSLRARVLARRGAWDALDAEGHASPRSRFATARQGLERVLAGLASSDELGAEGDFGERHDVEALERDLYGPLREVLGYASRGVRLERRGPVRFVHPAGHEGGAEVALVDALPAPSLDELLARDSETLAEPYSPDGDDTALADRITSAARLVSTLFVDDDAPAFVLVFAGTWLLLAERERWPEGRYLAIDLQLVVERNDARRGGEIDRALACAAADAFDASDGGESWWRSVLDESVRHTVGVSRELREGVRLSIEIIANEVVRRRALTGLEPLPPSEAQPLAMQSLRLLYRILFLLYAEASPELGVLPVGAPEYEAGYSLDRLRELMLVDLTSERSRDGTHLYQSLSLLFGLVDRGHAGARGAGGAADAPGETSEPGAVPEVGALPEGLTFNSLRADLFGAAATTHIDEVGLGDEALQRVLRHLLLSRERAGRDRGFISYADLGINQLGAVYEGLMSYTGFFADDELFEVAKNGDASKGSWVVPVHRAGDIDAADFVMTVDERTGAPVRVRHARGTFVFRLAGRERQQSASFYTPEVLTRFTVSQALAELLDQGGERTRADELLTMTVCEPALGSGAFAIEAVRQLAAEYLARKQDERGERIDPDRYPRELQRVKASIALHQVYGVDLNATAVELAEISLWLDTMSDDLQAPWFGLHLRRGNSLIGARRAGYAASQLVKKAWLTSAPVELPLTDLAPTFAARASAPTAARASEASRDPAAFAGRVSEASRGPAAFAGRVRRPEPAEGSEASRDPAPAIHHFLLPAAGWGSAVDAKEAKALAPEALAALKAWRKRVLVAPSKAQQRRLVALGHRVETLWRFALRRLEIAEREVRRPIRVWGAPEPEAAGGVSREQVEASLRDARGAYQRLRRVMDAWCALWFWPLTGSLLEGAEPPSLEAWLDGCEAVLGVHHEVTGRAAAHGQTTLAVPDEWGALGEAEQLDLDFAGAAPIDDALAAHPWLAACERIAAQQGFFHWHLDFATVFARGGFDLQVGNPPWVRPDTDVTALLAEGNPWFTLAVKPTQAEIAAKREAALELPGITELVVDGTAEVTCVRSFVGDAVNYPHLAGLRPDLYRCFMEQVWRHCSAAGIAVLVHPESHFTDERAQTLRRATYRRLRRHWQFVNEFMLYEVDHHVSYGIHVYGRSREPAFMMATSLYHPDTVLASLRHDGSGDEPGLKTPEGAWDLRGHRDRLIQVTRDTLATWHAVLEPADVPVDETRMVYTVNRSAADVLAKLAVQPRVSELQPVFSAGWNETTDRKKGRFDVGWGRPASWREVILQGPHLHVANPFFKSPNRSMKHNQDWTPVDLETLAPDAVPITSYKPAGDHASYDAAYTHWGDERTPARDHYRIVWRNMAANTGERTLIPSIVPPGAGTIHTVYSLGIPASSLRILAGLAGVMTALLSDFAIRFSPKSSISYDAVSRLSFSPGINALEFVIIRALRMQALSEVYRNLWEAVNVRATTSDTWTGGIDYPGRPALGDVTPEWTPEVPLRRASDRRQAQLEIDAIVALMFGVTADELCSIYRTQFPVLYGYDRNRDHYDANGRLVPHEVLKAWRQRGDAMSEAERSAVHPAGTLYTYELPFRTLDREADLRRAYAHFERVLGERS